MTSCGQKSKEHFDTPTVVELCCFTAWDISVWYQAVTCRCEQVFAVGVKIKIWYLNVWNCFFFLFQPSASNRSSLRIIHFFFTYLPFSVCWTFVAPSALSSRSSVVPQVCLGVMPLSCSSPTCGSSRGISLYTSTWASACSKRKASRYLSAWWPTPPRRPMLWPSGSVRDPEPEQRGQTRFCGVRCRKTQFFSYLLPQWCQLMEHGATQPAVWLCCFWQMQQYQMPLLWTLSKDRVEI